jgi:hypothetical protein
MSHANAKKKSLYKKKCATKKYSSYRKHMHMYTKLPISKQSSGSDYPNNLLEDKFTIAKNLVHPLAIV